MINFGRVLGSLGDGLRLTLVGVAGALLAGCGSGTSSTGAGAAPVAGVPQLSLSATALSFGSVSVGASSAGQTVTLTNSGTAVLLISGIAASGDFSETSAGCGASLGVGATCQVAVVFTPTAVGARTGTLTVTSNAAGSPQTVALSGTGVAAGVPQLSVSASALGFGTTVVGGMSGAQILTLTNSGTAALTISNVGVSGDFGETSSGCGVSLIAGATCQVSVVFGPTAAAARTGTLTIASNVAGGPLTVALSGMGVAATAYSGVGFSVTVRGGSVPIGGASVLLFAAGTQGNGSAAVALLANALTTATTGTVVVPGGYLCPSAGSMLYLVSRGGTLSGAGAANPNVALMTALGACNGVAAGAPFTVDEATTVAAAYGLAQFYSVGTSLGTGTGGDIGATGSNGAGLANAFLTAGTLADPVAGTSPGMTLPVNASSPALRVNSAANLLNACVVSKTVCAALYAALAPASGSGAASTLDAAFALARNPGRNVAALYAISQMSTAYAPALTSAPTDWTMFVVYAGGGMNGPSGIGVDSAGAVWVANYFYTASKFSSTGAAVFPNGITGSGLNNSYGLAVDGNDSVWIANEQPLTAHATGSVTVLSSAGVSLAGTTGYTAGGVNYPVSVAIDPNGTAWVVDNGDSSLTLLNSAGMALSGASGYTTAHFSFPVAVALDGNHFGWVANQSSNYVTKVAADGSSFANYLCCDAPAGVAVDAGNNVWVANYYGDSVSLMTNAGVVVSSSLTGAGSIDHPHGIAVDGAGTVWVTNYRVPYLTELAGAGTSVPGAALSPATGLGGDAGQLEAYALALDASGNVWVSNFGSSTVTKFIGLAVPVKTPLLGLPQVP